MFSIRIVWMRPTSTDVVREVVCIWRYAVWGRAFRHVRLLSTEWRCRWASLRQTVVANMSKWANKSAMSTTLILKQMPTAVVCWLNCVKQPSLAQNTVKEMSFHNRPCSLCESFFFFLIGCECLFWYRLPRIVPDKLPLNGLVCIQL